MSRRMAVIVIVVATLLKLAFFAVLDRPWGCECGQIWALPDNPALNSRVVLDPYSLMHLITGALLVLILTRLRPRWSLWALVATVVISSTVWELVENLPVSIDMFGYDPGDPLAYRGDSRVNALADTAAAALGAVLARPLPIWLVLGAVAAIELGLSLWIGDGFVIATLRAALALP